MAIEPIVQKFKLGEEPKSAKVWRRFSYAQRIDALESIRRDYHLTRYGNEPRLQRVLRITQQTRG